MGLCSILGTQGREKLCAPYETLRISIHRALQSLERRGLIASYMFRGARCWALPERLSDHEKRWVSSYSAEEHEHRRVLWQWGWFIRRLPLELRLTYRFGIGTPEQMEELKRRAEEWKKAHLT